MFEEKTFPVTMIRVNRGLPTLEVGAFRYTAPWLPVVGDLVTITRATSDADEVGEELLAYVTRVDPTSDTPIRVTEAKGVAAPPAPPDDYIVAV